MQRMTLKARKDSDSQYYIGLASIDKEGEKYVALLTMLDRKKKRSKYAASDIRISGRSKETVCRQMREIALICAPDKDVNVIDLEELKKLYEE